MTDDINNVSAKCKLNNLTSCINVLYISTYIPRKCGLATFTKDLTNAINLINPLALAKIAAIDTVNGEKLKYPHEVKYKIRQNEWEDYQKIAEVINKDNNLEIVCLQHEFGIYGGESGNYIINFLDLINKPIVTTLHTVIQKPDKNQKKIIQKIFDRSKYVVVMAEAAVGVLGKVYNVDTDKIAMIHHGVPDFPKLDTFHYKKLLRLKRKIVMVSANLLSEWKGIEYALAAVPKICKKIPNFIYLIVGQTHPSYLKELIKQYGRDVYREKLLDMVKKLKIQRHVRFINKYVSLTKLIHYIGAADFYITPYSIDSQQTTSGALAYAIGAGKLCISTPYVYAKEMLGKSKGILVPFKDSSAISSEVVEIYNKPKEKAKREALTYEIGRTMTWINVAHLYFHLFKMTLKQT